MRKRGLFLALLCGLLAVGVYRSLAQTGSDSAARFTENAMKLRENILFKVEPNNLKTDPFAEPGDNYPWHSAIVTTVFWIGESPTARAESCP